VSLQISAQLSQDETIAAAAVEDSRAEDSHSDAEWWEDCEWWEGCEEQEDGGSFIREDGDAEEDGELLEMSRGEGDAHEQCRRPGSAAGQTLQGLELYAGCGGLAHLEEGRGEGVSIVIKWSVECWPPAAATYRANHTHTKVPPDALCSLSTESVA
jgi:hypothetical protein